MVVSQLAERSLPTPEVRFESSHRHVFALNCIGKTKIMKNRLGIVVIACFQIVQRAEESH